MTQQQYRWRSTGEKWTEWKDMPTTNSLSFLTGVGGREIFLDFRAKPEECGAKHPLSSAIRCSQAPASSGTHVQDGLGRNKHYFHNPNSGNSFWWSVEGD